MRINSILFVFLGLAMMLVVPKTRKWLMGSILNNAFMRKYAIRIGMSIPTIRKRVIQQALPNFD